jgi:hypothetical protein
VQWCDLTPCQASHECCGQVLPCTLVYIFIEQALPHLRGLREKTIAPDDSNLSKAGRAWAHAVLQAIKKLKHPDTAIAIDAISVRHIHSHSNTGHRT